MSCKRRNILFLNHGTDLGGAEIVLLTLLQAIDKNAFKCCLVCPRSGELIEQTSRIPGVSTKIIEIPAEVLLMRRKHLSLLSVLAGGCLLPKALFLLLRFVIGEKFDLIYTNSTKAHIYGSAIGFLARVPVVWRAHDILSLEFYDKKLMRLLSLLANLVPQKLLCVSLAVAESYRAAGVRASKLIPIYNGMSINSIGTNLSSVRKELRLSSDCVLVGWFGRLTHWKGVHVLLEAAQRTIKKYPNVHFLIVGGPLYETQNYRDNLVHLAHQSGIGDHVTFTGYRKDVLQLMSAVQILTHTSILPEPFGMVLIEGALLGKAMIATNAGGVPEIIGDNCEGLLVPPNDATALAEALGHLIMNPLMRDRFGAAARLKAEREFSLDICVSRIEAKLQDAIARR